MGISPDGTSNPRESRGPTKKEERDPVNEPGIKEERFAGTSSFRGKAGGDGKRAIKGVSESTLLGEKKKQKRRRGGPALQKKNQENHAKIFKKTCEGKELKSYRYEGYTCSISNKLGFRASSANSPKVQRTQNTGIPTKKK